MRTLLIAAGVILLIGTFTACASYHYVQDGKTDRDSRRDYNECENTIVIKHGGWKNVEPFTASGEISDCMDLKGYRRERVSP